MSILVTGGAGYIGSHVADAIMQAGFDVVVVDDLSTGKESFIPQGTTFVEGAVDDPGLMATVFNTQVIDAVIHLAGYKFAGLSVEHPLEAYRRNTIATTVLLNQIAAHGLPPIIFSSSCSVYGDTGQALVNENFPLNPASPYGRSKLASELIIRDVARSHGLVHTSLRYFNVIGTRLETVWDVSRQNIVPSVHDALLTGKTPRVNGVDYNTPDGTCVRDYVDVGELADAHLAATRRAMDGLPLEPAYNLGSERGASVREVIETSLAVAEITVEPEVGPRRVGDPASIIATSALAEKDLNWRPSLTLRDMVAADWDVRSRNHHNRL